MSRKKKKILFLSPLPPPYMGPTVATQILLNSKLKEIFTLIHLDTSDHREINTLSAIDFQNILLAFRHYLRLFTLILKYWPDMVYIPISQTTVGYVRDAIFILISKLFGRKIICHLRGGNFRNWYNSASALTRWFVRNVHSFVDGQIVLGESLKYLFKDIIPKEKTFVVPNGKDIKFSAEKLGKNDGVKILFLSNLIRTKGIFEVLKSVPHVYRHNCDVKFFFAGGCYDKNVRIEIEKFIRINLGLPIEFKGIVNGQDKYNLLFSSDIFVFPTYYPHEGHPWVIVEAMAAGLPIITCDQGAIAESVLDRKNGYIVPKKNPKKVAERIIELVDDEEMRKKMGEESRKLYLENFTEDKMVERLSSVFDRIIN